MAAPIFPIRNPHQQTPNNQRPNNQQPRQQQPAPGQVPQQQPRPNQNDSNQNNRTQDNQNGGQSPSINYPRPGICGEPRTVLVEDQVLQMSYQLVLPCGVSSNQAIQDRRAFESAQTLANNVAARLQQNSFMNRMQQAVRSQRISGQVSEATQSPSYWDHFINPEIPTWRRMLAGAALPIAGPLTLLGSLQGCGTVPDLPREVPEASVPPSDNDPACDGRRSQILSNDPLSSFRTGSTGIDAGVSDAGSTSGVQAELNRQFPGITLPELNVTYRGSTIFNDSQGNPIRSIQTSDP
ncbi:MAG: hypothetical protein JNK65_01900, partial [Deltaproteobacteria bacterium]|nr:hypothetical protein [Deltaproteobacteria bacterium]